MPSQNKYLEILALLAPVGAVGVPLVFGSSTVARESEETVRIERPAIQSERVSERLAAIREAVSAVAAEVNKLTLVSRSGIITRLHYSGPISTIVG